MDKPLCSFYEPDENAEKEASAFEAACRKTMGDGLWQAERQFFAKQYPTDPDDPRDGCYGCKFYCRGGTRLGFPGETIYDCGCPGHEHIIYIDFDPSAVI